MFPLGRESEGFLAHLLEATARHLLCYLTVI